MESTIKLKRFGGAGAKAELVFTVVNISIEELQVLFSVLRSCLRYHTAVY